MPLFWRLSLANAATLAVAFIVLVAGDRQLLGSHGLGIALLGAGALVLVNAAVIGNSLGGLTQLQEALASDDESPVSMPDSTAIEIKELAASYDTMRQRLARERMVTARAALKAQEDERRAIARDLHDEVGQNLTFLLLRLRTIAGHAPPDLAEELAGATEAARATLDQVRQLSRQLRPGALEDLGLRSALAALVDDVRQVGVKASLTCPPGLAPDQERDLVVYRVVQEALTNVVKHAEAESVTVTIQVAAPCLVATVADDGNGATGNDGTGTASMRERARLVGGTFSRTAVPGRGTEVRIQVPLTVGSGEAIGSPTHPIPTIRIRTLLATESPTGP